MSLREEVTEAVHRRGQLTVTQMEVLLPQYTRKQISHAVENAKRQGTVCVVVQGRRGASLYESVYGPANNEPLPPKGAGYLRKRRPTQLARVVSVFDIGQGIGDGIGRSWPPRVGTATVYRNLGPWETAGV